MTEKSNNDNNTAQWVDLVSWWLGLMLVLFGFDLTTLQFIGIALLTATMRPWVPRDAEICSLWRR